MPDILHLLSFSKVGEVFTIADTQLCKSLSDNSQGCDRNVILCQVFCEEIGRAIGDDDDFVGHRALFYLRCLLVAMDLKEVTVTSKVTVTSG